MRGRWQNDRSLLVYLDISAAVLLQDRTLHLHRLGDWLLGDLNLRFPWWR